MHSQNSGNSFLLTGICVQNIRTFCQTSRIHSKESKRSHKRVCGNFENQSAVAVGAKAIVGEDRNITITAGVGMGEDSSAFSGGIGWSF